MNPPRVSSMRRSNPGFPGLVGLLGDVHALELELNRLIEAEQLGLKWVASPEMRAFIHMVRQRDRT